MPTKHTKVLHSTTHKPTRAHHTRHIHLKSIHHHGITEDPAGNVTGTTSTNHHRGPHYHRDSAGNVTTHTRTHHPRKAHIAHRALGAGHTRTHGATQDSAGNVSATTPASRPHSHKGRATIPKHRHYYGEPGGGPWQGYIDSLKKAHRYSRHSSATPKGYHLVYGGPRGVELVKNTGSGHTHTKRHPTATHHHKSGAHRSTHHATATNLGSDSRNFTPNPPGPINPTPARIIGHAGHSNPKAQPAPRVTPASTTHPSRPPP